MQRGNEHEPICNALYEEATFSNVNRGGFFRNGPVGCSPDGLVGTDGITEYKSQQANVHFKTVRGGKVPSAYRWQVLFNTWVSQRQWCDFASYCPDFPEGKRLFVVRQPLDVYSEEVEKIAKRLEEFLKLVQEYKNVIESSEYMVAA